MQIYTFLGELTNKCRTFLWELLCQLHTFLGELAYNRYFVANLIHREQNNKLQIKLIIQQINSNLGTKVLYCLLFALTLQPIMYQYS